MKKSIIFGLGIIIVFALSLVSPVIASALETDAWYTFGIAQFPADTLHLNTNSGGWLDGYLTVSGSTVHHPILGKYEGGKAYFAVDGLYTGYTMIFYVININTRDGYIMRITEGMALNGPTYVSLVTAASKSVEGVSVLDETPGAQVTPQAWYYFHVNPWVNNYWLSTSLAPWLWGYDADDGDLILGYKAGNRFFLATDFWDGTAYYELSFKAGSISTRDGYSQRTTDGMSYILDYFWLT